MWGEHHTLDYQIEQYLNASTLDALYSKILTRYEQDYERERPGLVRDVMSLLWGARRGISEAELMDLVGSDGQPLPIVFWTPLYRAAEQSLVSRSGLINFSHDYLRRAVEQKYLAEKTDQQAMHLRLANYFAGDKTDFRQIDELPWQLSAAQAWARLANLLTQPAFFDAAWRRDQFEVKRYWAEVEQKSHLRMIDFYSSILDTANVAKPDLFSLAELFKDTGHTRLAFSLWKDIVEYFSQTGDRAIVAKGARNIGIILCGWGRLEEAMSFYKNAEEISQQLGNKEELAASYGDQSEILQAWGNWEVALAQLRKAQALFAESGNENDLQKTSGSEALILYRQGQLDEALVLEREREKICRALGQRGDLAMSCGNQAVILFALGRMEDALTLNRQAEALYVELGDKDGIQRSYGNQAGILQRLERLQEALALYKRKEALCLELGKEDSLAVGYGNQALIMKEWGRWEDALALLRKQEAICLKVGRKSGLGYCYYYWGLLARAQGDSSVEREKLQQALAIFTEVKMHRERDAVQMELEKLATH
jgi:tetratricopeptide (TPR) repeat protein